MTMSEWDCGRWGCEDGQGRGGGGGWRGGGGGGGGGVLTAPVCVGEVDDRLAVPGLVDAPQQQVGDEHEQTDDEAAGDEHVA